MGSVRQAQTAGADRKHLADAEARYHAQLEEPAMPVCLKQIGLQRTPGCFNVILRLAHDPTGRKACRSALQRRAATSCARSSGLAIFLIQAIGVGPIDRGHDDFDIVGGFGSEVHLVGVLEHVENQDRIAPGDALGVITRP